MKKAGLYYPELDSLRFIAFLLVLVHHAPYTESIEFWSVLSKYGWMGVDLFLCLSAFLFARLLYVEYQENGNINVRYFYLRRALRIWPLYFFFLSLALILSVQKSGWNPTIIQRMLGMATFTDNLLTASFGYSVLLYSAHMWTISYEEQFYLIVPWVLRKFYQIKSSKIVSILAVTALVGMFIRTLFIYYNIGHFSSIWVLPVTHFESVFGGLIIGLGLLDKPLRKNPSWVSLIIGVAALYLVTLLPNVFEVQWKLMLTYPLVGIGTSLILFAVGQRNLWVISSLFKNKAVGYLGKISYGLYVYHILGLNLAYKLTDAFVAQERLLVYPVTNLLLGLIITIVISTISYQFLEKPFLRLKEKFTLIKSRPI